MTDTDDKKVKEKENEVLRRMLNTPPQPHKPKGGDNAKAVSSKRHPDDGGSARRAGKG
jgi:hypothetical protein